LFWTTQAHRIDVSENLPSACSSLESPRSTAAHFSFSGENW
jgi:hypothetical protein